MAYLLSVVSAEDFVLFDNLKIYKYSFLIKIKFVGRASKLLSAISMFLNAVHGRQCLSAGSVLV